MTPNPTSPAAAPPVSVDDELEALRKKRDARQKVVDEEKKARELAELRLEDRLESEIGRRGIDYQIIETEVGLVAVKLGEFVVFKRFDAVPLEKKGAEDVIQFVTPCVVHPSRAEFGALIATRPGIAYRCARALLDMFSGKKDEALGKY